MYAPISRSIVVACQDTRDGKQFRPAVGNTTTDGATPAPCAGGDASFSSFSSLRVFDADTLEERPGNGPLRFLPGVRVTEMTLVPGSGRNGNFLGVPMGKDHCWDPLLSQTPAAAIGGDVVAVACCRCATATDGRQNDSGSWHLGADEYEGREQSGKETSRTGVDHPSGRGSTAAAAVVNETATPVRSSSAAPVTTVIAAFEVVACGDDGDEAGGNTTGKKPDRTTGGIDVNDVTNGHRLAPDDGHGTGKSEGGTFLASLAAAPAMEGACFCLEALGERFIAGSTDDKIIVLGWEGSERGSFR